MPQSPLEPFYEQIVKDYTNSEILPEGPGPDLDLESIRQEFSSLSEGLRRRLGVLLAGLGHSELASLIKPANDPQRQSLLGYPQRQSLLEELRAGDMTRVHMLTAYLIGTQEASPLAIEILNEYEKHPELVEMVISSSVKTLCQELKNKAAIPQEHLLTIKQLKEILAWVKKEKPALLTVTKETLKKNGRHTEESINRLYEELQRKKAINEKNETAVGRFFRDFGKSKFNFFRALKDHRPSPEAIHIFLEDLNPLTLTDLNWPKEAICIVNHPNSDGLLELWERIVIYDRRIERYNKDGEVPSTPPPDLLTVYDQLQGEGETGLLRKALEALKRQMDLIGSISSDYTW